MAVRVRPSHTDVYAVAGHVLEHPPLRDLLYRVSKVRE
jgi:hypothetical protein